MLENKGSGTHRQSWPQLEGGSTETVPLGQGAVHLRTPFMQSDSANSSRPVDRVTITQGL